MSATVAIFKTLCWSASAIIFLTVGKVFPPSQKLVLWPKKNTVSAEIVLISFWPMSGTNSDANADNGTKTVLSEKAMNDKIFLFKKMSF